MKDKTIKGLVTVVIGLAAGGPALAEPQDYQWSSTTGSISSASRQAIEEITGQVATEVQTPVGPRWIVPGTMEGTFTYDPDIIIGDPQPRGLALAYSGPTRAWTSRLYSGNGLVGTFSGDVGEVIVREGDGAPGGPEDLVNASMCGAPCGDGVQAFQVGSWEASYSSVVWTGEGFQDGLLPPDMLPPGGAPRPLGIFGFFNNVTGENVTILTVQMNFGDAVQSVAIDIKPGDDENCFNINGHGVVPVAILGSDSFDVSAVDQTSLSFGGLSVRVRGNRYPQCSGEFVDGDGYMDLVCQFEDDSSAWTEGSDSATLSGLLLDGARFEGSDTICLVPAAR